MLTSWWVLADICNVLELRTDNVKPRLNSEDVNTVVLNHSNTRGNPNKVIINESGLYQAVMKSRLPSAEGFQDWVTDEVLPSIRKHGVYMAEEVRAEAMISPDFLRDIAHTLEEEIQKREALEVVRAKRASKISKTEID